MAPKTKSTDLETDTNFIAPAKDAGGDEITVTVTKFGSGQVSTGEHVAGEGDIYAQKGEKLRVSPAVAARLETLGFAEIDE